MQSPEVREIDGHSWTVVKFTGRESLALFRRLTALAAEPIADAIMTASKSVSPGEDIDVTTILAVAGGAIGLAGKVSSKLTDDEFVALAERLLKFSQCDNKPIAFDSLFQGGTLMLLKVLAFVVEVNFVGPFVSSFGPAVSSALRSLTAKVAALSPETSSETRPTA